jgi:hypothetical protein
VKFGKYVTGSIVKVHEKFGFNWSILGWFGHFTEHLEGEELGFRRNDHLRCENPPEGAENLQEYSRNIGEHNSQLGCTGFHRNSQDLDLIHKEVALSKETEREREKQRGGKRLLTEEG